MQTNKDLQIHQSLIGTRTFRIKEWNFVVIELASCSGIPQFVIKTKTFVFFWLTRTKASFSFLMISLPLH